MLLSTRMRGFSLIELMVVVSIIAILTIIGIPTFSEWLQNSRTRSVAESLQNGFRFAQAEAARTSRLTTLATTATGWTITYTQVAGGNDTLPTILQKSPADNLTYVSMTVGAIQFNDLGRASSGTSAAGPFTPLTAEASFDIANTNTNMSATRRLSVRVSPSGKIRMCDPDKSIVNYPDGC